MYYSYSIFPNSFKKSYSVQLKGDGHTLIGYQNGKPIDIGYEQTSTNTYIVQLSNQQDFDNFGIIKIYKIPSLSLDVESEFRARAEKIEALRYAISLNLKLETESNATGSPVDNIIDNYLADKEDTDAFYVENPGGLTDYDEIVSFIAGHITADTLPKFVDTVDLANKKYLVLTKQKYNAMALVGRNSSDAITHSKVFSEQVKRSKYSIYFDDKPLQKVSDVFECDPIFATVRGLELTINACFEIDGCDLLTYNVPTLNSSLIDLHGFKELNPNWQLTSPSRAPQGDFKFGLTNVKSTPLISRIYIEGEKDDGNEFESPQGNFPELTLDDTSNEGRIIIEIDNPAFTGAENLYPIMSDLSGLYQYNKMSWTREELTNQIKYTSSKQFRLEEPLRLSWADV